MLFRSKKIVLLIVVTAILLAVVLIVAEAVVLVKTIVVVEKPLHRSVATMSILMKLALTYHIILQQHPELYQ